MRTPPVFLVGLLLLAGPGRATASDEELQTTLTLGYSAMTNIGDGLDGLSGGVELTYGLATLWSLSVGGSFAHHFESTVDDRTYVATDAIAFWVAPRLNLDVFVLVPYISLGPEILIQRGELMEKQEEVDAALRAAIGFDYRPQREWSVGFEVGWHAVFRDFLNYPMWVQALFRVSYHHNFGGL